MSFQNYQYRAAAFSGVRTYDGVATGGVRVCAVISCAGDTIESCGNRFPNYEGNATAIFEELSIVASVPTPMIVPNLDAYDSVFYPITLNPSIMPLGPKSYNYEIKTHGDFTELTLSLIDLQAELYTFAVWGRVFAGDGQEPTPALEGSSCRILYSSILAAAAMGVNVLVKFHAFL